MRVVRTVSFLLLLVAAAGAGAADSVFKALPAAEHDARVPTLESVVGHGWGDEITTPAEIAAYARALAAASDRVRLVEYARSLEGRPLLLLVVGSTETLARLDAVKADLRRLGDPRATTAGEAPELAAELPVVVWVACSVHGDETSGGDAGLALAYHLAAGRGEAVDTVLSRALVIVDPMQNPDGRARFVASTRQGRGALPDPDPAAAEHVQPWPGGRFSHDLFDLNRDWFALTHPETAGRVAAMLEWSPAVVMDLHEMGAEMGYFFAPPATPRNPLVSAEQGALWELVGRANAAAFDEQGWRYWTREIFDAFYPGYGETWPFFSGVVGMTYEQASSRGLAVRLDDDTVMRYADAVAHHLTSAFTTCLVAASNAGRFLASWRDYRADAMAEGRRGPTRAFLLVGGEARSRAADLARLLVAQGIEVERITAAAGDVPADSFLVRLDQPLGRLARTLLARRFSMGEAFEKEQERRWAKRLPDQIYDITAWSLPLLWNVPVRELREPPTGARLERVSAEWLPAGDAPPAAPAVAYLLPWDGTAAVRAVAELLADGVKLRVAGKPFTIAGRRFERGTIVIRVKENGEHLGAHVQKAAERNGVRFSGADSGYSDAGIDLGSSSVRLVSLPRIAVLWDTPTRATSAGAVRHVLERIFGLQVTALRARSLGRAELGDYDVLVVPDAWGGGAYLDTFGEAGAKRLAGWVRDGGVLIGIGGGAAFLCEEKVALLASHLEKLGEGKVSEGKAKKVEPEATPAPAAYEERVTPEKERPPSVPGAIVRVDLDRDHLLSAGFPAGRIAVLVNSSRLFAPLPLDRGTNVGLYAASEDLIEAGFMLRASREQLPRRAYLMETRLGRGHVIAFAEDPAFRAFARGTMQLLANAVLFGSAI